MDGLIVAGDALRDDHPASSFVVAVSSAAKAVAYSTVRREVQAALDLGTGSGVQALLAARHADRVVGVDVNPHALSLAGISQRLNRLDNITWLQGDWLEPVRGRRFDLVVANPPVVISPDNTLLYRDSAIGGEQLSRRLIGECAEHLAEGGFATVFCNWTHAQGAWEDAPREWVDGLGCDALLLNFGSRKPLVYAMGQRQRSSRARSQAGHGDGQPVGRPLHANGGRSRSRWARSSCAAVRPGRTGPERFRPTAPPLALAGASLSGCSRGATSWLSRSEAAQLHKLLLHRMASGGRPSPRSGAHLRERRLQVRRRAC